MRKHDPDVPEVYLEPGESRVVRGPVVLKTVLGSCVGVAFRIPRLGVGALCHPMLPNSAAKRTPELSHYDGRRYVDFAIRELAKEFDKLGATREETQVKLFGGADVFSTGKEASKLAVGKMNGERALEVLMEEGFSVMASSLGGNAGIHIEFHTGTGEVLLRRLQRTHHSKSKASRVDRG